MADNFLRAQRGVRRLHLSSAANNGRRQADPESARGRFIERRKIADAKAEIENITAQEKETGIGVAITKREIKNEEENRGRTRNVAKSKGNAGSNDASETEKITGERKFSQIEKEKESGRGKRPVRLGLFGATQKGFANTRRNSNA